MNVASLELCKELYELSGWDSNPGQWVWHRIYNPLAGDNEWSVNLYQHITRAEQQYPAYDLGYLLRRFAEQDHYVSVKYVDYAKLATDLKEWRNEFVAYDPWMKQKDYPYANTPEDALAKLAIELFKQNILTNQKGA